MSNISLVNPHFKGIIWDEFFSQATTSNVTGLWNNRTNPNFELIYLVSYMDYNFQTSHIAKSAAWLQTFSSYPKLFTTIGFYPRGVNQRTNLSYIYEDIKDISADCNCSPLIGAYPANLPGGQNTAPNMRELLNQTMTAESDGYGGGVFLYNYYGQALTDIGNNITDRLDWYKGLGDPIIPEVPSLIYNYNIIWWE